jgi:hypothetical protein
MAIEEEFALEIPDNEADKIGSIAEAVKYIASHPQVRRWGGGKGLRISHAPIRYLWASPPFFLVMVLGGEGDQEERDECRGKQ